MIVNTPNGTADVASNSKGNTALGLGIAGLATSLLSGGMSLLGGNGVGLGRNGYYNGNDPDSRVITKAEANLMHENDQLRTDLAIKTSEGYTDKKLVEVTTYLDTKLARLSDKVDNNFHIQQEVNAQQLAYNAALNATIDVLKAQVGALNGITKMYVPSSNVCQSGCGCGCNQ